MSRVSITIQEFKEIIKFTIDSGLKQPILGLGAPGIGKSEVIKEIGEELGYHVEDLRLAQMSEVEIGGLIYPSEDKTKTNWLKPDFFPEEGGPKTILLLDEITSAPKRIQVAAYQLVLDRKIGKHTLPDSTIVIALGNREDDGGVYVDLAAPLADRFEIYDIECNTSVWLDYARDVIDKTTGHSVNPFVTSFISGHPDKLHTQSEDQDEMIFATPRSWKRVSDTLNVLKGGLSEVVELKICATIGDVLGTEFIAYCKHYASNNKAHEIIEGKPVTMGTDRAEILYVTDSVVSILNGAVKSGEPMDRCKQMYNNIVKFAGTLDGDYSQMVIAAASAVDKNVVAAAMNEDASITDAGIDNVGAVLYEDYSAEGAGATAIDGELDQMEVFF